MHNAAIRALGLDAVYVAIGTPAAALPPLLAALGAVGGAGNVTVPHKEAVERCLARKTDLCARVGACNTFWTEQGELVGANTDVAINATPLGLKETDPLPLDPARTHGLAAALDLVYAPGETRWVRALRAAGIAAQDGRELLVHQGAAAFNRFFPAHPAPVEVMR